MKNERCAFYALVIAPKIIIFPKKYFILFRFIFGLLKCCLDSRKMLVLSKGLVKLLRKMKCEENLITF